MNDVENDLIDLLQMKADEAMAQAPHRMPAELRRQARRRHRHHRGHLPACG